MNKIKNQNSKLNFFKNMYKENQIMLPMSLMAINITNNLMQYFTNSLYKINIKIIYY